MHRVGKKDNNCFFWPKTIKDRCWYEYDDVLAVIPESEKKDGSYSHYQIQEQIWNQIMHELKRSNMIFMITFVLDFTLKWILTV
jgi:hypothetical protein